MTLSPFSDRPTCPRCGSDGSEYQSCTAQKRVTDCPVLDSDHLHMACTRCSSGWLMAEKDK